MKRTTIRMDPESHLKKTSRTFMRKNWSSGGQMLSEAQNPSYKATTQRRKNRNSIFLALNTSVLPRNLSKKSRMLLLIMAGWTKRLSTLSDILTKDLSTSRTLTPVCRLIYFFPAVMLLKRPTLVFVMQS
jgi:hypothetical protein